MRLHQKYASCTFLGMHLDQGTNYVGYMCMLKIHNIGAQLKWIMGYAQNVYQSI